MDQTLIIVVAIIVILMIWCFMQTRTSETFMTPFGFAPTQADLVEISMRRNMYPTN